MTDSVDDCCRQSHATIHKIQQSFLRCSNADIDSSLRVFYTLCSKFPSVVELCGELHQSPPTKAIGACLANAILSASLVISYADENISPGELDAIKRIKESFKHLLYPPGTLLENLHETYSSKQVRELLDNQCGLDMSCAAILCASIDLCSNESSLELLRDNISRMAASVAAIGGTQQLETLRKSQIDELIVRAASHVRNHITASESSTASHASMMHRVAACTNSQLVDLNDARKELEELIGLNGVKLQVQQLMAFLAVQKRRKAKNLAAAGQTLHFVFTGNPGTGKTTVARILGRILFGLGFLQKPDVIECSRADLVAGYVGQTALKTSEVIEKAKGGILFIDEAYALFSRSGTNDFGSEAIDTLLKKMEDYRDKLVVVVAGYPNRMAEFIASNPGLKSRFTKYIHFSDYEAAELCQIFELFCKQNDYTLSADAKAKLSVLMYSLCQIKEDDFGNGRLARNVFDDALNAHAMRIAYQDECNESDLTELSGEDISYDLSPQLASSPPDLSLIRWSVICPNCGCSAHVGVKLIGRSVICKKCSQRFICPWYQVSQKSRWNEP